MTPAEKDYFFDLNGYLILDNALSPEQLRDVNRWVDTQPDVPAGTWLGDVEVHSYQGHDGISYQNIIEGGHLFEELIDNPAWIHEVRRYICSEFNKVSLNECLLNVRQQGGFIGLHSGGHTAAPIFTFRHHTGAWQVGQINILMALTDIGPGDGATVVIPGSHKSTEIHPALRGGTQSVHRDDLPASEAAGSIEVHLKAGQALMFTDAIMHGSCPRTNPGERRIMIYRYCPHWILPRYNYVPSERLLAAVKPEVAAMIQPKKLRMNPQRTVQMASV